MFVGRSVHVWCGIQAAYDNGQIDDDFFDDYGNTIRNFAAVPGVKELIRTEPANNHPTTSKEGIFRSVFQDMEDVDAASNLLRIIERSKK